jgi:phenylacetate-CoA ligase
VIVTKLNAYAPTAMVAYPSLMQLLAGEQIAGRLRIAPKYLQCTSEVLTDAGRDVIAAAFKIEPANLYAASECGCIAATCSEGSLHIAEDLCLLEIVDEKNRPVPDGEEGAKALLTVFASRTIPLIRYELSDRLIHDPNPCTCGLPFARLKSVSGRTADILDMPGRSGGSVQIAWAQISACLRDLPLTGWQMTTSAEEIVISCVARADQFNEPAVAHRVRALIESKGAIAPPIRARRIDRLERGPSGKAKLITVQ